ncbi:MAG: iron-containing alcohol dehydrogenase, partial [Erysipelotrichaceae bacterium]|nr:iron-containing alcohol dehydrogenase [Erysipelotrichaceae bacterium]
MFKLYCRMYQSMMKVVSKLLPWKKQKLLNKVNGIQEVSEILRKEKIHHPLFITDNTMVKLKLSNKITDQLNMYAIYSDTVANPTTTNVMEAYSIYLSKQCDGII